MVQKDNVLLISLGHSPAVIPETLDALLKKDIYIKRTYIVTTSDEMILNDCIPLIEKDFAKHYKYKKNMELFAYNCILTKNDIYTEEDNLEIMINVAKIFKKEKQNNIYISIAGGRKTMSAAMSLLAQIYSARAITHVLVSPEIESEGSIFKLKEHSPKEIEEIFHPDPENMRLIFFPVIGISWMLSDMINALLESKDKVIRTDVTDILRLNGLLDENNKPTFLGLQLLKLLDDIEKFPDISFKEPNLKFKKDEGSHAPRDYNKFVARLANIPFIESIIGVKFINSPKTQINNCLSNGTINCQYSDGDKAYVLKILTTATTSGEVELVKNYLKKFFVKI